MEVTQSIADVLWAEFVRMVQYKAKWYGKKVVKVDKLFVSSQTWNDCGYVNRETKKLSVGESWR